jgi:hypothetical protein
MERFLGLILAAVFFTAPVFAAQPGNAPVLTIAAPGQNSGSVSIPLSMLAGTGQVFSVFCYGSGVGASTNYPCFANGGTQYKVGAITGTGSPKAYCFNFNGTAFGSTSQVYQIITSSATFAIGGSLSSATYQCGATGNLCLNTGSATSVPYTYPGTYTFLNAQYVGVQSASGSNMGISFQCFEQ